MKNAKLDKRITELDGLRGLMTIMVVVSHYYGEVQHGWKVFMFGWVAVKMFFVLSGFLVGRLAYERHECVNFISVFYIRRLCRTIPVYMVCVLIVFLFICMFGRERWLVTTNEFPLWSYLTFTQNYLMVSTNSMGWPWLAPTWTLSVEEYFYLFVPVIFLAVPVRYLIYVFSIGAFLSVALRISIFQFGIFPYITGLVYLPSNADAIFIGMIAGIFYLTSLSKLNLYIKTIRIMPFISLSVALIIQLFDNEHRQLFQSIGFFIISVGCSAFILSLVMKSPESTRFNSRILCFFGDNSYSIYLTHLSVLGVIHGILFNKVPDIESWRQLLATTAALPLSVLCGWVFTKIVEAPFTRYGRQWRWAYSNV